MSSVTSNSVCSSGLAVAPLQAPSLYHSRLCVCSAVKALLRKGVIKTLGESPIPYLSQHLKSVKFIIYICMVLSNFTSQHPSRPANFTMPNNLKVNHLKQSPVITHFTETKSHMTSASCW